MFETIAYNVIIFLAGFIQGLTGFGFVLIALPLLTFFMDIKTIIPLTNFLALLVNISNVATLRGSIPYRAIGLLLLASLPGIPLGVYLLKHLPPAYLTLTLGTLLIGYYFWWLLGKPTPKESPTSITLLAGFISGCLGGSIGAGGPPVIVYSSLQPWHKNMIKSLLAGFFLLLGVFIAITHIYNGLATDYVLHQWMAGLPALGLGVLSGILCYRRLDGARFKNLVMFLILVLGVITILKELL